MSEEPTLQQKLDKALADNKVLQDKLDKVKELVADKNALAFEILTHQIGSTYTYHIKAEVWDELRNLFRDRRLVRK